ncbi:hypothetical protein LZ30DRAFT_170266 [Colletotrichum cereale]|nr:hypothetical protein LZ30DRAFT_170266 [Colletotrichum cereale]
MWMKRSRARKATLSASRVPLSSDEDDHRYFHRVLFDIHVVSPPVSKNTIRGSSKSCVYVWTCCQCGDSGMTINIAHCPVCYYDRCTHCPIAKTRVRQS